MIESASVLRELKAQDLDAREVGKGMWGASFDVGGVKQEVLVFIPTGMDYFAVISPISSDQLASKPSGLTRQTLVTLLEVGSSVALAKVEFREFPDNKLLYAAVSYCSTNEWTGEKLRLRMRDVAVLGARVEEALSKREANVG